jgi:hypothetical protein
MSRLWQLHSLLTVDSSLTQHLAPWPMHLFAPIYKDCKVPDPPSTASTPETTGVSTLPTRYPWCSFREQLLLLLHAYGIPNNIWQHLRTLHHSICVRVLHGHNAPTSYINILKGLTEGRRLCPLLWGVTR